MAEPAGGCGIPLATTKNKCFRRWSCERFFRAVDKLCGEKWSYEKRIDRGVSGQPIHFFQCLNGKRLPKESFFEHLLRTLQLSPGEESKLRKLYHIAQIGESVYQNRQCAKKCLETLAACPGI